MATNFICKIFIRCMDFANPGTSSSWFYTPSYTMTFLPGTVQQKGVVTWQWYCKSLIIPKTLFLQGHILHTWNFFFHVVLSCSIINTLRIIGKDFIFMSILSRKLYENKVLRIKNLFTILPTGTVVNMEVGVAYPVATPTHNISHTHSDNILPGRAGVGCGLAVVPPTGAGTGVVIGVGLAYPVTDPRGALVMSDGALVLPSGRGVGVG